MTRSLKRQSQAKRKGCGSLESNYFIIELELWVKAKLTSNPSSNTYQLCIHLLSLVFSFLIKKS